MAVDAHDVEARAFEGSTIGEECDEASVGRARWMAVPTSIARDLLWVATAVIGHHDVGALTRAEGVHEPGPVGVLAEGG